MDAGTRQLIRDRAVALWLRADLETLVTRTSRRNNRPLLNRGDPRETLERLMHERYPVYAEADIIVDSQDCPPEETARLVHAAVVDHFDKITPTGDAFSHSEPRS